MYKNLELAIVASEKSKAQIASELGIGYNTLLLKLNGKNKFTLDEAVSLKDILKSPRSIEELFEQKTA